MFLKLTDIKEVPQQSGFSENSPEHARHRSTQRENIDPYLSEVQSDVHLVELGAAGQRRALPPSLRPVDGVGDGMGAIAVALAADVTVLALRRQRHRGTDVLMSLKLYSVRTKTPCLHHICLHSCVMKHSGD